MGNNNIFVGIFLISLATLALEISLIRFFSISQWYHFAFMVVSIALFGIAASGTFLTIKKLKNPLFISSILFSLSALIGFLVTNKIIFDPFEAIVNFNHVSVLLLYYIFLGLPFFFFGIIIAYCFSKFQNKAGKVYFYNMSGSAVGVLASLFFISYFNVKTILVISFIGLFSSLFFINNSKTINNNSILKKPLFKKSIKKINNKENKKLKKINKIISLYKKTLIKKSIKQYNKYNVINKKNIVFVLIFINLILFFIPLEINISKYKELSQALNVPNSKLIDTKYNSFSRVDIVKSSFTRYAPGLSPTFRDTLPEQIGITIDASSMNSITKYENLGFVDNLPSSVPYFLDSNKKTLIINSGAGLDVLAALKNNATVTALETNPIIIDLLKNEYAAYSGNIYNKANLVFGEGRSFIKNNKKFDIILVSLAGNVLSGSAGISGLSENYLLTQEAFEDYYDRLSNDGFLVVTRWLLFPPRESLRLFSLALEIDEEAKKIVMFRSWTTVTLILSRKDLDQNTIKKIKNFTEKNKFDIIYLPTDFIPNKNLKFEQPYYYNSIQNLIKNKNEFYNEYIFDVRAVTDDKPFYFNFFKISKIKELNKLIGQKWNPLFDSGFLLFFMLLQAIILALIFILLPIKFFNKNKINRIIKKRPLVYFFAIGLSYLFIEIVLIQKFVLFLGHIIFSSSTIIFSMLLFSSLGALYSERFNTKKLSKIIIFIFILVIFYIFLINFIINYFISLDLISKIILTAIFIAPLGFFMGFPFPLGMRAIKKELIPWAWGINGSASVLSPILAIIIALFIGYNFVLFLAGLVYLVGYFFIN
tara:strand:- start:588 stop:3041 length:2454 start_codon:yes stop_codon:yes gene_type:complete